MSKDEEKPKRRKGPRRVLPACEPWAQSKNTDPGVKKAILTQHLRRLEAWGYTLDDVLKGWRRP
jgi:hypothetical protein